MKHPPEPDSGDSNLSRAAIKNWREYWSKIEPSNRPPKRSQLCSAIKRFFQRASTLELNYQIIIRELRGVAAHWILEPGCGGGGTASRLVKKGYQVVFLDSSHAAIHLAKSNLEFEQVSAHFIIASVYNLPFKDGSFDFEFNIGVLDHLGLKYRTIAIGEMLRTVKVASRLVIVVNSIHSFIHPIAMRHAQKRGIWRFGYKEALSTLRPEVAELCDANILREYGRGLISQFEFLRYYLPQKKWCLHLFYWLFYVASFPFAPLNFFPGQYTVSVIAKQTFHEHPRT